MLDRDPEAFDAFCGLYPGLYRFAARRLGNDSDLVMEVTQNTVLKAIEGLESFRGESTLFTWMCSICRFEVIGHYKRMKKSSRHVDIDDLASRPLPPWGRLTRFALGARTASADCDGGSTGWLRAS